jgi:hypothetical protein
VKRISSQARKLVEERDNVPKIAEQEFVRIPLRVHEFLAGVPLHDVWAVDLPRSRPGITLDAFLQAAKRRLFTPSPVVSALLRMRSFVGRLFGWDLTPSKEGACGTFADRLTTADRISSLAAAGVL